MKAPVRLRAAGRDFPGGLVIFDLDGTLVDSVPDIAAAVDATAIAADLAPPGEARVRQWVGNGSWALIRRMLAHGLARPPDEAEMTAAHELFLAAYQARLVRDSRLYPGSRALLDALRDQGIPLACVTNKPEALARGVLQALDLERDFSCLLGGDSLAQRKPAPEPLYRAMDEAGVQAADSLLIGDSETDVAAARAAGCSILAFRYGYNRGFREESEQPDAFVDSLSEIEVLESE